jgi:sulfoxide reductase heme-binding subunit YedZ
VLLVPLAITSTARMLKRLGFARWKRLHRLAYAAGVLGVVHFFLRVKKDHTEPVVYGVLLAGLLGVRVVVLMRGRAGKS